MVPENLKPETKMGKVLEPNSSNSKAKYGQRPKQAGNANSL